MTYLMPLLVLMTVVSPNPVQAIEMTSGPDAPTLRITAAHNLGPIEVSREGEDLVLRLRNAAYRIPKRLVTFPPVRWGRVVNNGTGLSLYLRVAHDAPYKISQSGGQLQVQFAPTLVATAEQAPPSPLPSPSPSPSPPASEGIIPRAITSSPQEVRAPALTPSAQPAPPVAELYGRILPVPTGAGGGGTSTAEPAESLPDTNTLRARGQPQEVESGFLLGPAVLRPSVATHYIDATTELTATNDQIVDRYFQVEPRVRLELPIRMAELQADYVARIRAATSRNDLRGTSHFLDAALRTDIGPRLVLLLNEQFRAGIADTNDVDPGRELPFRVIDFRSNQLEGSLRVEATSRLGAEVGGGVRSVRHDSTEGKIEYDVQSGYGRLTWMLTPTVDVRAGYAFDRIPLVAERPYLETHNKSASFLIVGEIIPLLRAEVYANYQSRRGVHALEGDRYLGWVFSGRLIKEITPSTNIQISGHRTTPVSSFERNAFFVSNAVDVLLNLGLPAGIAMRASAGYYKNDYPTVASQLGVPRQDRTPNWAIGLGRPFGRRLYVRADYSEFRRNSNLDELDRRTHAFSVQVGVGLFGTNVVNQR